MKHFNVLILLAATLILGGCFDKKVPEVSAEHCTIGYVNSIQDPSIKNTLLKRCEGKYNDPLAGKFVPSSGEKW